MCGICGVVGRVDRTPPRETIRPMVAALHHRGPDGWGYIADGEAAFGHSRLAIVDPAGGAQPMCLPDGSLWLTFNGEIFNYIELRAELRALGHHFHTASDTEVALHAYAQWGDAAFERFNGQWAMALYAPARRRLTLSRDRVGIVPLYLTRAGGRVLFASEVKALFAVPGVTRRLDPAGLAETFTYWSTVAPRTVFDQVEQVPPGQVWTIDDGVVTSRSYWAAAFPDRHAETVQDEVENARELRDRLLRATRLRFTRSDVPVAAYLSGGVDSAVTAAAIASETAAPLRTFSVRFADAAFDEGSYQHLAAQWLGCDHEEITVTGADIAAVFPDVIRHTETPILRTAPAPLFVLSDLVRRRGFRVVVTGEGSDEVLGGYDIYREARVREFVARDPESAWRARALEDLYPWLTRTPGRFPAFARGFFGQHLDLADPALSHRPRWHTTSTLLDLMTPACRERAVIPAGEGMAERMPPESVRWDSLSRAQWLEMTTLLPGYILASQGDRMLMAHSVEGRFPFLDPDVIDFAQRMPARHKLLGLREKHLLKLAFRDDVPEAILERPKQPYRAPDATVFFGAGSPDWVTAMLEPSAVADCPVFEPGQVEALARKCRRAGARGTGGLSNTDDMRIVAAVSTQLLHHGFVEGAWLTPSPAPPTDPNVSLEFDAEKECPT